MDYFGGKMQTLGGRTCTAGAITCYNWFGAKEKIPVGEKCILKNKVWVRELLQERRKTGPLSYFGAVAQTS